MDFEAAVIKHYEHDDVQQNVNTRFLVLFC